MPLMPCLNPSAAACLALAGDREDRTSFSLEIATKLNAIMGCFSAGEQLAVRHDCKAVWEQYVLVASNSKLELWTRKHLLGMLVGMMDYPRDEWPEDRVCEM